MSSPLTVSTSLSELIFSTPPKDVFPPKVANFKQRASERLAELGVPSTSWEPWKYIDLSTILSRHFTTPSSNESSFSAWAPDSIQVLYSNGKWVYPAEANEGISFRALSDADVTPINLADEENPFVLFGLAAAEDALVLDVSSSLERPIHIVIDVNSDNASVVNPAVWYQLSEGASASVIVTHASSGAHFINAQHTAFISKNASLSLGVYKPELSQGILFDSLRLHMSESSQFEGVHLSAGCELSRFDAKAFFNAEDARLSLNGLSILSGESKHYSRTNMNHLLPACTSTQMFKSILLGRSNFEYNGLVHVAKHAQLSDASQSNQNLLLSDHARAWSRPQLQIHADDVKAAHGANVGQLDDAQVFYLKSRGLSDADARALLLTGFAEEVGDELRSESQRSFFERNVARLLSLTPFKEV